MVEIDSAGGARALNLAAMAAAASRWALIRASISISGDGCVTCETVDDETIVDEVNMLGGGAAESGGGEVRAGSEVSSTGDIGN